MNVEQKNMEYSEIVVSRAQQRVAELRTDRLRRTQEQMFSYIFGTPVVAANGDVVIAIDNQANRSVIGGWAHESQMSPAWLINLLDEQPQLASQIAWRSFHNWRFPTEEAAQKSGKG